MFPAAHNRPDSHLQPLTPSLIARDRMWSFYRPIYYHDGRGGLSACHTRNSIETCCKRSRISNHHENCGATTKTPQPMAPRTIDCPVECPQQFRIVLCRDGRKISIWAALACDMTCIVGGTQPIRLISSNLSAPARFSQWPNYSHLAKGHAEMTISAEERKLCLWKDPHVRN